MQALIEAGSGPIFRPSGARKALASAPMTPGSRTMRPPPSSIFQPRQPPASTTRTESEMACPERLGAGRPEGDVHAEAGGQRHQARDLLAREGLHHDLRHEPVEAGIGPERQRPEGIAHHSIGREERRGLVPEPPVGIGKREVIGTGGSRHGLPGSLPRPRGLGSVGRVAPATCLTMRILRGRGRRPWRLRRPVRAAVARTTPPSPSATTAAWGSAPTSTAPVSAAAPSCRPRSASAATAARPPRLRLPAAPPTRRPLASMSPPPPRPSPVLRPAWSSSGTMAIPGPRMPWTGR